MARFWYTNYTSNKECEPTALDWDSLLRWDFVIIRTKEELLEVCSNCEDKWWCAVRLTDLRREYFNAKKNKNENNWVPY